MMSWSPQKDIATEQIRAPVSIANYIANDLWWQTIFYFKHFNCIIFDGKIQIHSFSKVQHKMKVFIVHQSNTYFKLDFYLIIVLTVVKHPNI